MNIQNNNVNRNINFGTKIDTSKVLEVTTMKIFKSDGIEGFKDVYNTLNDNPVKFVGCRGYKYYADLMSKKIVAKYPEIAEATRKVLDMVSQNPKIKKAELNKKIQPIIDTLGKEVDITI